MGGTITQDSKKYIELVGDVLTKVFTDYSLPDEKILDRLIGVEP